MNTGINLPALSLVVIAITLVLIWLFGTNILDA